MAAPEGAPAAARSGAARTASAASRERRAPRLPVMSLRSIARLSAPARKCDEGWRLFRKRPPTSRERLPRGMDVARRAVGESGHDDPRPSPPGRRPLGARPARRPVRRGRARAGAPPDPGPAQLLLPRDVSAAGHERPERGGVVARRKRARLRDAGDPLAPEARIEGGRAVDRRARVRLGARLVPRRPAHPLHVLPQRCAGAPRARPAGRNGSSARLQRSGEPRRAMVPRRPPRRVCLDRVSGPMAHLPRLRRGRRSGGRARPHHRRPRQRPSPHLLLALRSLPVAGLVAGREGAPPRFEPGGRARERRALADGNTRRRADASRPERGDQLEGPSRLGARRPPRRLQLVSRPAAQPALARDRRRRGSFRADLLRLRSHPPALVPRRPPHRLREQRGGQRVPARPRDPRRRGRDRAAGAPPVHPPDRNAPPHGDGLERIADAGAAVDYRIGRPGLGAGHRVAPRRRRLRPEDPSLRDLLFPRERDGDAHPSGGPLHRRSRRGASSSHRPRAPWTSPRARRSPRRSDSSDSSISPRTGGGAATSTST